MPRLTAVHIGARYCGLTPTEADEDGGDDNGELTPTEADEEGYDEACLF